MKLVGKITWDDVRSACIEHDWYTHGDSEAYIKLAENVNARKNVNLAEGNNAWCVLMSFAVDIKLHSDTDYNEKNIVYVLLQKIHWDFEGEDEEGYRELGEVPIIDWWDEDEKDW